MIIGKETVREAVHGHTTVGATAVQLTTLEFTANKGVMFRAPGTSDPGGGNTAPIWVGFNASVKADSSSGGGFPILPGAVILIPIDRPNLIWVISTAPDQDIAWIII